jgi:hypothetical protein
MKYSGRQWWPVSTIKSSSKLAYGEGGMRPTTTHGTEGRHRVAPISPSRKRNLAASFVLGHSRVSLQVSTTQDSHLAEKHLSERVTTLQEDAAYLLKSSRRPLQPKRGDMSLAED